MVKGTDDPAHGMKVGHRRPTWGSRSTEHSKIMHRTQQREAEERAREMDAMRDDPFYRPPGWGRYDY